MLRVDQLVFGYREGHELLAGSIDVDPRQQLELLPHADARFEDDSEHYLVGLPLLALELFMLVRIWPAPELPRPGAVWAHALLLNRVAMDLLDPVELAENFRRPTTASLETYVDPLLLVPPQPRRVDAPVELMETLCLLAYGGPQRGPVVLWSELTQSEDALLALWRGLPTDRRATYSFRTRGRARAGNSPYALQIAARFGGRSPSGDIELWDPRHLDSDQRPAWAKEIASASLDPADPLGCAIRNLATDVEEAVQLTELWPAVRKEDPVRVLSALETGLSRSAPTPIADALFGSPKDEGLWGLSEGQRVEALLRHGVHLAADEGLLPASRMAEAWKSDHDRMLQLFDERFELPSLSTTVMYESGASALSGDELTMRAGSSGVLELIISERQDLLAERPLWESVEQNASGETIRHAVAAALTLIPVKQLIRAMLAAKAWHCLALGVESSMPVSTLAAELSRECPTDSEHWEQVFVTRRPELLDYLAKGERVRPEALVLGAATLGDRDLQEVRLRRWVIAGRELHARKDAVAVRAGSRLLCASLGTNGESARKLLIDAFGPVQAAIEDDRLDQESAYLLDRSLPKRKWGDLSERLSKVLVESMESSQWSRDDLLKALEPAGERTRATVRLVPKKNRLRRALEATLDEVLTIGR